MQSASSARVRRLPLPPRAGKPSLAPADHRHRVHGDDRQPAIWLDPVRPSDERGAWLVDRRHPDRLQPVCRARNLADPDRGLDRRPHRPEKRAAADGGLWRRHDRDRAGSSIRRADTCRRSISARLLSGVGAGAIYATCVGNAVKWFPDRRGLAVGLTAAGFGAGAALTVIPIRAVIAAHGYAAAFFWFGLVQGAIVFIIAWLLRAPYPGETPESAPPKVMQTSESYSPRRCWRPRCSGCSM